MRRNPYKAMLSAFDPSDAPHLRELLRGEGETTLQDLPAMTERELELLDSMSWMDAPADTWRLLVETGKAEPSRKAEAGLRLMLVRMLEKGLVGFKLSLHDPTLVWQGRGWDRYAGKAPREAFWLATQAGKDTILLEKYRRGQVAAELYDPEVEVEAHDAPREVEFAMGPPQWGDTGGWPDLPWTRRPTVLEPGQFEPWILEEEARYDDQRITVDYRSVQNVWQISAWDVSDYMQGMPWLVGELWLTRGPGDSRKYGRRLRFGYASVASMWIHPEWRDRGLVEAKLYEAAAQLAAGDGMALASSTFRAPPQEEFWLRQQRKGRARLDSHIGRGGQSTTRYFLRYPPPESLENPRSVCDL